MRCASEFIDPDDPERSCGFLTATERQHLLGEWEPGGSSPDEGQQARKDSDIKTRTRHALADLVLLQQHASEDLKTGIVTQNEDEQIFRRDVQQHMLAGMVQLSLEFTYGKEFADQFVSAFLGARDSEGPMAKMLEAWVSDNPKQIVLAAREVIEDSDLEPQKRHPGR